MRKKLLYGICVLFVAFTGGGGCNLFSEVANKTSDAAIFDDATNLINRGLWNDAILKLQTMSAAGQAQRATIDLFASAYAGRGGLNILSLVNTMNDSSSQAASFFLTLFKAFKGATYNNFLDQITAETYITTLSPNLSQLTTDEALFLIFVEFAKMGTLFVSVADPTGTGSVPAAFDSCTGFTNYQANEVALAVGLIVNALPIIGDNAIVSSALAPIVAACQSDFSCGIIDPSTAVAPVPEAARTLIGESHLGIGLQTVPQKDKCEFTAPNGNCEGAGALVTVCTP